MGKPTGFLEYARVNCPVRDAAARMGDYAPLELPVSEKNRRRQAGRCMDCGVPMCQAGVRFEGELLGCPLHNLIPEWNDLLWSGSYESALERLLKTSPFPEFTARVCPALCERACICGRISEPVTVRENELAVIEYGFENDLMQPVLPQTRSDKRVAVVGSGPAGLAAAYYLNRRGHHVTVYEKDALPGGLLTYGIPEMKLPKAVVARRIALLKQEGIAFVTGCEIGKNLSAQALAQQADAVIFCCGAQQPRTLSIADSADGAVYALDYLRASAQGLLEKHAPVITAEGKNVVIIGAGDSASDCVSIALRQRCKSITQLIRKPKSAKTEKLDRAHEEAQSVFGGDIRRYETQAEALERDEAGRLTAVCCKGSGERIPCELLLIASGFSGCGKAAEEAYEAVRQTGVPVLKAGDMDTGASLVVMAIAGGKQAAAQMDALLMGYTNIL